VTQWLSGDSACSEPHLARIVDEVLVSVPLVAKRAVLSELLLLRQQLRIEQESNEKWTPGARKLAQDAFGREARQLASERVPMTSGRTLVNFPSSFYPLVIVTGDKRETSESRINRADFGAVSASPAEARWLQQLRLDEEVELLTDKLFVLESEEQLRKRFGETNLLVIGSPGSNHLARRIHLSPPLPGWRRGVPIFRFKIPQEILQEIEDLLADLAGLNAKQLAGKQADPATDRDIRFRLKYLFTGGILDPSFHDFWVRAVALKQNLDFGLISLARNPFSKDDHHVSILVSGFHMFGTAHGIAMLSRPREFKHHPLGGVIRVTMNEGDDFAVRFDNSTADWDMSDESNYTVDDIRKGVGLLRDELKSTEGLARRDFEECLEFIDAL
jgi:hypothetical protein